ncbi:cysteine-rich repeat secretory protein 38-like [Papaver somniferum]|uniref:cysteine-rich repeat secretory protein 38-like n=1 Tax=Papaver somniferum TaxID=3469 RepID=UPI000E7010C1|nr:cysteine-rich repeat secretory protein 38-like [Papaver somniferum]
MKLIPLYYLLTFTFTAHIVFCQNTSSPDPLYHFCFGEQTYSSSYGKNLQALLNSFSVTVPPTGFGLGSMGQAEDRVNGFALCRGDIEYHDCNTCLATATSEIHKRCSYNKGAVIWHDNCAVKYSDEKFLGKIDVTNKVYMWNLNNVSDPSVFNKKTRDFITSLSEKAVVRTSMKLFATGEMALGGYSDEKLYGLVQCSRDLSSSDCKKCLDDAVNELPNCCEGKRGGRVIGGSCNIRYELYPFVKA